MGFESVDNGFGGYFIDGVTEADGSEITDMKGGVNFWDEGNEGVINLFENLSSIHETKDDASKVIS